LLEQGPSFFQGGEVLFLLVLAAARTEQAVLAQDTLDGSCETIATTKSWGLVIFCWLER
jgi:hypothetical protein